MALCLEALVLVLALCLQALLTTLLLTLYEPTTVGLALSTHPRV